MKIKTIQGLNSFSSILIFVLFNIAGCKNKTNDVVSISTNSSILDNKSLSDKDIKAFLDTSKKNDLIDSAVFLNFKLGQPRAEITKRLNDYIKKGIILTGHGRLDTTLRYYFKIPTRIYDEKNRNLLKILVDSRFYYEKDSLSTINLILCAPWDCIPNDICQEKVDMTLDKLNELAKGNGRTDYKKQNDAIDYIGFRYVREIYDDLKDTYIGKYGEPKIIKLGESFSDNLTQTKLLWVNKGRWIYFDYLGTESISKKIYFNKNFQNSSFMNDQIYLGNIRYSSLQKEVQNKKDLLIINQSNRESNIFDYYDSIQRAHETDERDRSNKIGI
jgi:hypothetical protein